jgi:hypothetical protein
MDKNESRVVIVQMALWIGWIAIIHHAITLVQNSFEMAVIAFLAQDPRFYLVNKRDYREK